MVCKIFEADVAAAKQQLLSRFLKAAQAILLLLNVLTVGFMTASGVYNVRAADQYMLYSATTGDNVTILDNANHINNLSNINEGVSSPLQLPQSFGCC